MTALALFALAGALSLAAAAPVAMRTERLTPATLAFADFALQQKVAALPRQAQRDLHSTLARTHLKLGDNVDVSDEGVVRISDDFEVDPSAMQGGDNAFVISANGRQRRDLPSQQKHTGFSDSGECRQRSPLEALSPTFTVQWCAG